MANIPTIEEMLKAGMHFGHRTSKWHPKMKPFIFGSKNGVHVIDLTKSRKKLEEALDFMKKEVAEGKTILFVGTKIQVKSGMKKMAEELGMPYITEKWLGGTLTNYGVIRKMVKKLKDLSDQQASGRLDRYTKKEKLEISREITRLETKVGGLANLNKMPDAVFIWDIKTENTGLAESLKKRIPVVALCDTNVNPTGVKYIIPANDDATKTIKLVLNTIKEGLLEAKEAGKKVEAAKVQVDKK